MSADDAEDRPAPGRDRVASLPNANSPQLLTHLLEVIARGVRSSRGLEEALGVDPRTVRYYLHAGAWLGFLADAPDPTLTAEGLAYVYAGSDRRDHWVRALQAQPLLGPILRSHGGALPPPQALRAQLAKADPSLATSTLERRTSAVRALAAPAEDPDAARALDAAEPYQLHLPLGQTRAVHPDAKAAQVAGRAFSPDLYRVILGWLLDHGELSLGHLRAILDRWGAAEAPIGPYVDLALQRGDAVRHLEQLVITPQAVQRRELVDSTRSIILSDAGWREHLDALRQGASPGRWRRWDERIFGRAVSPSDVDAALTRVLPDRSLAAWPVAAAPVDAPPKVVHGSFLEAYAHPGQIITLPPTLGELWEGLAGVNRRLRNARHRGDGVHLPTSVDRPVAVHGGLFAPGESLPRALPDTRSLRQRVLQNAPYPAMVVGLLLLHRKSSHGPELRQSAEGWQVRHHRRRVGPLLHVLDTLARKLGCVPSRRVHGGLSAGGLVGVLEGLGVALRTERCLVLDDAFFRLLRMDDEEQPIGAALEALADHLANHLDAVRQPAEAP